MDAAPVPLDEDLWGPEPTEAQLADALRSARCENEGRLARVRAVSATAAEAARSTGVTIEAVNAAIAAGELRTIAEADGHLLVPTWQLATADRGGPAPAGISDLARVFPGSTVALTLWACRPSADLAGRTPAQALANGQVDAVIAIARALTAAGW